MNAFINNSQITTQPDRAANRLVFTPTMDSQAMVRIDAIRKVIWTSWRGVYLSDADG